MWALASKSHCRCALDAMKTGRCDRLKFGPYAELAWFFDNSRGGRKRIQRRPTPTCFSYFPSVSSPAKETNQPTRTFHSVRRTFCAYPLPARVTTTCDSTWLLSEVFRNGRPSLTLLHSTGSQLARWPWCPPAGRQLYPKEPALREDRDCLECMP